jgi:hypothetical protein
MVPGFLYAAVDPGNSGPAFGVDNGYRYSTGSIKEAPRWPNLPKLTKGHLIPPDHLGDDDAP